MRLSRTTETPGGIINITPLLDVMFILLIFFMATTTFKEEEFDIMVNLPDASKKRAALSSATKLIVVNVRGADRNKEDPLYVIAGQRVNLLQLRDIVADGVKNNVNQKVLIRGDNHAFWGDGARALATCRAAGVIEVNVGFDYNPTE
ncbi:MAG: biopolymer transporter ExbD [Phycisphaerae bacterium]|nr:biopolymer transporter ExbD [Phycisphaerae bacterium]